VSVTFVLQASTASLLSLIPSLPRRTARYRCASQEPSGKWRAGYEVQYFLSESFPPSFWALRPSLW